MIAQTIAQQIGKQSLVMIGAKNFAGSETALLFSVGRNSKNVNKIKINLDADDTYTVSGYSIRGIKITEKGKMSGIYSDQLNQAIESLTGMCTRL